MPAKKRQEGKRGRLARPGKREGGRKSRGTRKWIQELEDKDGMEEKRRDGKKEDGAKGKKKQKSRKEVKPRQDAKNWNVGKRKRQGPNR